ncbi:MAG: lipoyl-dependent peroxiredoxin [Actinomycetota bacterium]|nr:lipoyl-dependent peroxiredoxin [Actinomycetota bacterium]
MPVRKAEAVWEGTLQEGKGTMKLASGAYEGAYSFSSRFEDGSGTNPEELLAAAHAGCFSMALSGALGRAGFPPEKIETRAEVSLEKQEAGFRITRVNLVANAHVPGIEQAQFDEVADGAKTNCPVSQLFQGADITLDATLTS